MSTILLHPGDLSAEQWLLIIFVWCVLPLVLFVALIFCLRHYLLTRAKKKQDKIQGEV
jgi:hypothetical protein